MKKIFTVMMVIAVLLSTAVTGVYAKTFDPYGEIYALEYDESAVSLANGKTDFVHINGYIGDLGSGSAVVYRNVDFGALTPKTALLYAGLPENHASRVDLRLDSASGTTIATFNLKGTDWSVRSEQRSEVLAEVSGVHDVWLVQVGGNARLYSFKFIPEEYELEPVGQYDGTGDYLDTTDEKDKFYCELIGGLGFKGGNDVADPDFPVKRGDFALFIDWVMNYVNNGEKYFIDVDEEQACYEAITRLSNHDIVHGYGDLTFRPDTFITGEEAATICANALGYNKFLKNGYVTKKAQFISAAGIKNAAEPIDTISAMKMLYKFLTSEYMYVDFDNKSADEEKNILEVTRNIYLKTGVVDGNRLGYLDNPSQNTDKDYVTVDKTMYYSPECKSEKYLGRNCEFFVYQDKKQNFPEIISIAQEKRSTETVITHDDDPYIENNTLYYENIDGKEKRIKLSQNTVIIYNTKTYESADITQLLDMQNLKYENGLWVSNGLEKKDFQGEIRAVSYTGSNEADVIYVNCYDNVVNAGYDSHSHILRDKLSDKSRYINVTDSENYGIVTIDGVVSSVSDLKENMGGVIYESINVNGIKAVNAYYSTSSVSGKITSRKENKAVINSAEYEIAPEFIKSGKLEIGNEGDYVLTPYGEIVWVITRFSFTDNVNDRIVCFIKGAQNEDDDSVYLRVYDLTDGAVVQYTLADAVRFDGERTKSQYQAMYGTPLYENKMGIKSLKQGYVMKIRLNEENKVNFIDSPITCGGGVNDCLKMLTASVDGEGLVYRPDPKIFGSKMLGNKFAVNADAPVLYSSSPSSDSYEYDEFKLDTLASLGRSDKDQQVALYSFVNESSLASLVVKFTDVSAETDNHVYVFKEVSGETLDRNEEVTKIIELCDYGMSVNYTVSSKCLKTYDVSSIPSGSLVKLNFDVYGEITAIKVVYAPDHSAGIISPDNPESETTVNSEARMVLAKIGERDGNFVRISFEKNNAVRNEFIPITDIPVIACECVNSKTVIEKTGVSALTNGTEAVVILNYGNVSQIVLYK